MAQTEVIPAAVEAVLAGDALRFAEIVRAFDGPVRRIVSRTLRDRHALEDVVQEIWLRVYRQLATLLDVRTTEAWIGRIARNCVIDHHRQRQRLPRFDVLLDAACEPARGGWVWDLVDSMPEAQRQLLNWCYRDGHSYEEIGRRLAVPSSTVRGRLYEARLALRRSIEHRRTR
ncbi:MAG TPA: RNA polymerase sigma factor [Planctomycetota bacterium]|nr:RNA polymerase sigma factor [Planctomycetota bacterium]